MIPRVLVGIPTIGEVKTQTTASLVSYMGSAKKHEPVIIFKENSQLHTARNSFVFEAVQRKCNYVMMIDSDMVFPPDGIDHLISENKDIIGGEYFGRIIPFPVVKQIKNKNIYQPLRSMVKNIIYEVAGIGGGFLLININVFKKLMPPFFYFGFPQEFGLAEIEHINKDIDPDVTFCLKARKAGFKIWADNHIELGHVGKKIYTRRDNV